MIRSPFNRHGLLYAALGMGSRAAGATTHGQARRAPFLSHPAGPSDIICGHCGETLPGDGSGLPCTCGSTVAVVPSISGAWAGRKDT